MPPVVSIKNGMPQAVSYTHLDVYKRQHHNFAGELGLLPMEDGKTLDACMAEPMEDVRYVDLVVRVISFICGILNPQYVVLGGPSLQLSLIHI